MSENKKRLIAVFAIIVMFINLMSMTSFALPIDVGIRDAEVTWDFILTDEDGNTFSAAYGLLKKDNPYGYEMYPEEHIMHDYTMKRRGITGSRSDWTYGEDYVYCFCIEHGIMTPDNKTYVGSDDTSHGDKYEKLSASQKDLLGLALTYGYTGRTDVKTSKEANACYAATQLIVWQITLGFRTSATQLNDKTYPMSGYTGTMTEQFLRNKYLADFYNRILNDMAEHYTRPSFTADTAAGAPVYTMEHSAGRYRLTLTDTNGVLEDYYISSNIGGINAAINGNTLSINSADPIPNEVTLKLNRKVPETAQTTAFLIWSVPGKEAENQDMVSGTPVNRDPVPTYIKLMTSGGSLKVVKTSEDGIIENVRFNVEGTGVSRTVYTGASGEILVNDLKPGVYTVTETTDSRYESQESRQVSVVSGQTSTVKFNNKLKRGSVRVIKTAEDSFVEGIRFHLYGSSLSGAIVDEYAATDSTGVAEFKNVLVGHNYVLEEVDTDNRYIVPDSQNVTVEWDKVSEADFENVLKRGDLTVVKSSEDDFVEGIRFHLFGTSFSGIEVDEYAVTDSLGVASFKNILIGSNYTLEEADTAIRYVIPETQNAVVEWDSITSYSFDNILKKWKATVVKTDAEIKTAQGDATLSGAVYGIYKGNELIDRYTTDENGRFETKYYVCGDDWTIREISPSEGYLLDDTIYHVGAEAEKYTIEYNTVSIGANETVSKGRIAIIKHADDGSTQIETPEVGAEFEVYLKSAGSYAYTKESERDKLICDENGYAQTKLLPYGVYTVKQTKGKAGAQLMPEFDVYVSENGKVYRYIINNNVFKALVEIVKKDAETGKIIPISGIGFKVRNTDTGEYVVQHINYPTPMNIDTFYTDSTGKLMLPEGLLYGNYEIIEVQTAYGYVLDRAPVPFVVDGSSAAVTVVKSNMPQKGRISVTKSGEIFASVTESDGIFQPVYEDKGLVGAAFEIRAAEDIYTPDGTLRYSADEIVDIITTDENGFAASKLLYIGKYEIRETKAPNGMVLNGEPVYVEIEYADQEVKTTEYEATLYNYRQRAEIELNKSIEKDEKFGIGSNNEILSVQFGLFAAEDITAADGTFIPKDGLLETVYVDENGYAVFVTDIPVDANLYVKEIAADGKYILSDEIFPVVFEYAGQDTSLVQIVINNGEVIINKISYGKIIGYKTDRETGSAVSGAVFGLFRAEDTDYTDALLTAASDADGVFVFENVPLGKWIIKELEPADGFLTNDEIYEVEIIENMQVIEIDIVNDRIPEIGTTAAVSGEKNISAGGDITIDDVVSYKHLIPGKEYVLKGILMDRSTGKPFLANGKEVRSEIIFIPETPNGTVNVTFTFNTDCVSTVTEIVVFEELYYEGIKLAAHADIEDLDQTITVIPPSPPADIPETYDGLLNSPIWPSAAVTFLCSCLKCDRIIKCRRKNRFGNESHTKHSKN